MDDFESYQERVNEKLEYLGWTLYMADVSGDHLDYYRKEMDHREFQSSSDVLLEIWVSNSECSGQCFRRLGVVNVAAVGIVGDRRAFTSCELTEMLCAIRAAEDELLEDAVPFVDNYRFQVDNQGKSSKNRKNRRIMATSEWENILWRESICG